MGDTPSQKLSVVALGTILTLCAHSATAAYTPRVAYMLHCGGCHGMTGGGSPPLVPSLLGESGLLAGIPEGRDYLIRVPGSAQSRLDDAALARVLTWMLETFCALTLPKYFKPFTAAEVARSRATILMDPLRRRAEIQGRRPSET